MIRAAIICIALLLGMPGAIAQQSERFGRYELHYSVVNSTFISPQVASQYGIVRGDDRAFINIAVREHREDGSAATIDVELTGESWDLTGRRTVFDFIEIREGEAIYYIGEFEFLNREWRHFEVEFRPRDGSERHSLRFKRQMYREQ
jgi:hypothetical protein